MPRRAEGLASQLTNGSFAHIFGSLLRCLDPPLLRIYLGSLLRRVISLSNRCCRVACPHALSQVNVAIASNSDPVPIKRLGSARKLATPSPQTIDLGHYLIDILTPRLYLSVTSHHTPQHSTDSNSMAALATRYKLIFHAPLGAVEACKQAIFSAGAGH